ncbi:MAG: hypothetical protein AAF962_16055 [Actinomycetota bacterium]
MSWSPNHQSTNPTDTDTRTTIDGDAAPRPVGRTHRRTPMVWAALVAIGLVAAACSTDDATAEVSSAAGSTDESTEEATPGEQTDDGSSTDAAAGAEGADDTADAEGADGTADEPTERAGDDTDDATTEAPATTTTTAATDDGELGAEADLRYDIGKIITWTSNQDGTFSVVFDRFQLADSGLSGPALTEEPSNLTASDVGIINENDQLRTYIIDPGATALAADEAWFTAECSGEDGGDLTYDELPVPMFLDAYNDSDDVVSLTFEDERVVLLRDQRGC